MHSAEHSPIGRPSSPTSAASMVGFLTPPDVSSSFIAPSGIWRYARQTATRSGSHRSLASRYAALPGPVRRRAPQPRNLAGGALREAVAVGLDGRVPCPRSTLPEIGSDLHRRADAPCTGLGATAHLRRSKRRHTGGLGQRTAV